MMNLDGGSYDCDGIHEHSAKLQLDLMESMNNTEIGGSYTSQLEWIAINQRTQWNPYGGSQNSQLDLN